MLGFFLVRLLTLRFLFCLPIVLSLAKTVAHIQDRASSPGNTFAGELAKGLKAGASFMGAVHENNSNAHTPVLPLVLPQRLQGFAVILY